MSCHEIEGKVDQCIGYWLADSYSPVVDNSDVILYSPPGQITTVIIMSCDMRFPTMWYVRPAKAQTSLRIRAV